MKLILQEMGDLEAANNPVFVGLEKNLIRIGFFSIPNIKVSKKQEKIVKLTTVESHNIRSQVEILAPSKIGLPTTGDLTMYLAFQSIVQDRFAFSSERFPNPVSFTNYELLNRAQLTMTKERYGDLQDWLIRMKSTTVRFEASDSTRKGTDAVSVFNRVISSSDLLDDGSVANCNYVWLSEWGIENLRTVVPIDMVTYSRLKNQTAKLLVPHLQVWLYASRNQNVFRKNYAQFCALLGITQYSAKSKVVEKLAPAMSELGKYEYIKKWELTGTRRKGYVISITHGPKFFRDQKLFFVLGGGKSRDETAIPENNPNIRLLPEIAMNESQERVMAKLISREIDPKSARQIALDLTEEEVELRIGFCDHVFAGSPGKVKNERGYLFTILKDENFVVPSAFLENRSRLEELSRRMTAEKAERESQELEDASLLAAFARYEEYCLKNAPALDPGIFARSYESGSGIWQGILKLLKQRVGDTVYDTWFAGLRFLGYDHSEQKLVVLAGDITAEWITQYYSDQISASIAEIEDPSIEIDWYSRTAPVDLAELEEFPDHALFQIYRYQLTGITFDEFRRDFDPPLTSP